MGTQNKRVTVKKEQLEDDLSEQKVEKTEDELDDQALAELKARLAAKESKKDGENVPAIIVEEKTRSIQFGVLGSGQGGTRLASALYARGYPTIAINTAQQDLEHIEIPESNKLLLQFGLGGAGKELSIGAEAAEAYRDAINQMVHEKLGDAQLLLFCTSLGGGSGAGSAEVIVDILSKMERPVAVITILPMSTDDAQTKHNAVTTLSKFTNMVRNQKIDNLIVVDNARIETIYCDVGPLNFFGVSNEAIVDPIDQFNTLSSKPSSVKGLDPTEFGKLFTDGKGLTIYGMMKVPNYTDDTAIAEAVVDNLSGSLLASGFNLKETRYAGALFVANSKVWEKIPNASVNYAMSMVNDVCGSPLGVFRGIYTDDKIEEDVVRVYSMFSGLGLPNDRIQQLKNEAKERMQKSEEKDEIRAQNLKMDVAEESVSAAEAIKKRIQAKKSSFGKLHNRAVVDRRK